MDNLVYYMMFQHGFSIDMLDNFLTFKCFRNGTSRCNVLFSLCINICISLVPFYVYTMHMTRVRSFNKSSRVHEACDAGHRFIEHKI